MDGHRAPVFELLSQTRSVDTQTPNHGISATDIFSDQLPIMLEVNELVNRSDSQGSDDHSACSSRGVESEERSQSVSPSFIPGKLFVTCWRIEPLSPMLIVETFIDYH